MAKRFTDTKIWDKQWFRQLPPRLKEFWRYVCDHCDGFALWNVDLETASHFINETITAEDLKFFEGRFYLIGDKIWCPRWLKFHYKQFRTTNKVHVAVARKTVPLAEGLSLDADSRKVIEELSSVLNALELSPDQPLTDPQVSPDQGIQEEGKRKKEEGKGKEEKAEGGVGETGTPPGPKLHPVTVEHKKLAFAVWMKTLETCGVPAEIAPHEEIEIGRAIQRWGFETVALALLGARHEPKTDKFDPKGHVSLRRVFGKDRNGQDRFGDFVNWGRRARAQAKAESEKKVIQRQEEETIANSSTDRAKVQKLLGQWSKAARVPA